MRTEIYDSLEKKIPFEINGYIFQKILGRGTFSIAFQVYSSFHKIHFCSKATMIEESILSNDGYIIDTELYALLSLSHRNILRLYDFFIHENILFYILEYCKNGTVQDEIQKFRHLTSKRIKKIMIQISHALEECHRKKIAHRDIKPSNLFLDSIGNVKLGDFGLSTIISNQQLVTNQCGSYYFCAPEMFNDRPFCPFKADIYSLGITFCFLLTSKLPNFDKTFEIPNDLDFDTFELLSDMLQKDPNSRPTIQQILTYNYFKEKLKNSPIKTYNSFISSPNVETIRIEPKRTDLNIHRLFPTFLFGKKRTHSFKNINFR